MSDFVLRYEKGLWYGTFAHMVDAGITHGISTRLNGDSKRPFSSLNLALHTGDDAYRVTKNRQLFCQSLGVKFERLTTAEQVHGDEIAIVQEADAGRGHAEYQDSIAHTDALITNCPHIPLLLCFADCVPVLLADPVKKVVAVAHAGWKGTVLKIAQKTVLKMQAEFGCNPADCLIGIGPSIGSCCYEVDDQAAAKVQAAFPYADSLLQVKGDKYLLDLWEANRRQLLDIGIPAGNISVSEVCTSCNNDLFFSYRHENGRTGRIGACISL